MNENIKDKETNSKNMDIQEFLDKCKTGNIDEKNIPAEILSVFEMLYAKRKEQEQAAQKENTAGNIHANTPAVSYIEGLSLEDIRYINEQAVSLVEKYTGEKFNMESVAHREYFEYFKQQALKAKEQEIKMKQFEKSLHEKYPQIRYHIASGNAEYVLEYLDKGLIDFGLLFCPVDPAKYEALTVPHQDTWGVLMRRDAPLAQKEVIRPQDLAGQPLILSHQRGGNETFAEWIGEEKMQVVATYNLLYNASLLVEAGLGYAVGFDKLINTEGSDLCFRLKSYACSRFHGLIDRLKYVSCRCVDQTDGPCISGFFIDQCIGNLINRCLIIRCNMVDNGLFAVC